MKDKVTNVLRLANLIRENTREKQLLTPYHTLLIALSGGQDSICCLLFLYLLQNQVRSKMADDLGSSSKSVNRRERVIFCKRPESLIIDTKSISLILGLRSQTLVVCPLGKPRDSFLLKELRSASVQDNLWSTRPFLFLFEEESNKNQNNRWPGSLNAKINRTEFGKRFLQRKRSFPLQELSQSPIPLQKKEVSQSETPHKIREVLSLTKSSVLLKQSSSEGLIEIESDSLEQSSPKFSGQTLFFNKDFPKSKVMEQAVSKPNQNLGAVKVLPNKEIENLFDKYVFFDKSFHLLWCNHFWQKDSFYTMLHVAKVNLCFLSTSCFYLPLESVLSEQNAREWRHKSIQRTCFFFHYDFCTQGHTKSDRVETILFNILRGTGITGLRTLQWKKSFSSFSSQRFYPRVSSYKLSWPQRLQKRRPKEKGKGKGNGAIYKIRFTEFIKRDFYSKSKSKIVRSKIEPSSTLIIRPKLQKFDLSITRASSSLELSSWPALTSLNKTRYCFVKPINSLSSPIKEKDLGWIEKENLPLPLPLRRSSFGCSASPDLLESTQNLKYSIDRRYYNQLKAKL